MNEVLLCPTCGHELLYVPNDSIRVGPDGDDVAIYSHYSCFYEYCKDWRMWNLDSNKKLVEVE